MTSDSATETAAFRAEVHGAHIGPRYRGRAHFAVTMSGVVLGIVAALSLVHAPTAAQLCVVPAGIVFANVVEYLAHRFLMHVERPVLGFLYRRHTLMHHRFFTAAAPTIDSARDFKAVLFPAPLIGFFLVGIALPLGLALSLVLPTNVAALFAATAIAYYGLYEVLHLTWHLPEDHAAARLGVVRALRRLHRAHHADMTRGFNVTFPVADVLFLTVPRALDDRPLSHLPPPP
jgi:hypothetical protein